MISQSPDVNGMALLDSDDTDVLRVIQSQVLPNAGIRVQSLEYENGVADPRRARCLHDHRMS